MKKEAEEWARIAIEELQSAEYLCEKSLFRMVCYHAQQAVEKVLKTLLVENEIDFPRTHNILDLNNAVKQLQYKSALSDEDAVFLNGIYKTRYPLDLGLLPSGEPTKEDAERALHIAQKMGDWFKEILE